MKRLAILPVAAMLVFAGVSAATAAPVTGGVYADSVESTVHRDADAVPYHHCHGLASGTASAACGSQTGGPSGGLF